MTQFLGPFVILLAAAVAAPAAYAVGLPPMDAKPGTWETHAGLHSMFLIPMPSGGLDYTPIEGLHFGAGAGFVGTFDGATLNPFDMGGFIRATFRLAEGPFSSRWGATLVQGYDYHFAPGMVGVVYLSPKDPTWSRPGPPLEGYWSEVALNVELPLGWADSPLTVRAMWGAVYGTALYRTQPSTLVWPPPVLTVPTLLLVPNLELGFKTFQGIELTVGGLSYFGMRRRF